MILSRCILSGADLGVGIDGGRWVIALSTFEVRVHTKEPYAKGFVQPIAPFHSASGWIVKATKSLEREVRDTYIGDIKNSKHNMSKRIYISADYSAADGDRSVVDELHKWGNDNLHKVDYCDTAQVVSGSVAKDSDCRACDLKSEFNRQINASSAVIFIIGDKTASRTAGSACRRINEEVGCPCTPYKQNANGSTICKIWGKTSTPGPEEDLGKINAYSYLKHEFKQAERKGKTIIIVYNSMNRQPGWLPDYMAAYANEAHPFWKYNANWERVGDYTYIKKALGYV